MPKGASKAKIKRKSAGHAACGCGAADAPEGRKAVAVDPETKERNLARLRRIEGQIRGVQSMIEGDRYCPDVMTQISAVHEALRAVGRELLRNHLRHCVASATREGGATAEAAYDEVVDLMFRSTR